MNFADILHELLNEEKAQALCTVVGVRGSTPRKLGSKMIVKDNGESYGLIRGTIGGGAIEHHIRHEAILAIKEQKARLVTTSLRNDLAMCCGGEMTVFIEPIFKKPSFICFGAGHIAQALCPMAYSLGFIVNVVDERPELLSKSCFSPFAKLWPDLNPFLFSSLPFGSDTFVLVATHDHLLDQTIIENSLKQTFKYLALVGSKRKALMTKKRLSAKGLSTEQIEKFICPAGLAINAQTPNEIALSIMAQMIEVKNEAATLSCADSGSWREQSYGHGEGLSSHKK